jgi:hypothetical protein
MDKKGKLGLLVDDGRSDVEIDSLCSGWLLPPVHDDGMSVTSDIKVQHVEWARGTQIDISPEQKSIDVQQPTFSPWCILWRMTLDMMQIWKVVRISQTTE